MFSANDELNETIKEHLYGISTCKMIELKDGNARALLKLLEGDELLIELSEKYYRIIEIKNSNNPNLFKLNYNYESLTALLRDSSMKFQDQMYKELVSKLEKFA
ncbi:hypothetical protein BB559_003183 [Furculomyces boomerangus]|uniref:GSKIP domain-containing protein n=1 Tax=Furculomyces boomerangus TaxID=61424 RepID=A0A2T9YN41_9FUNG|nr:hypothetical protein BB559_006405 [Furculomyces boomerangus]PVU93731.1 hypothetical protein BB559_003183 [Furculomyces boomerangus]